MTHSIVPNASSDLEVLRNRTFNEIAVGDHASMSESMLVRNCSYGAGAPRRLLLKR